MPYDINVYDNLIYADNGDGWFASIYELVEVTEDDRTYLTIADQTPLATIPLEADLVNTLDLADDDWYGTDGDVPAPLLAALQATIDRLDSQED